MRATFLALLLAIPLSAAEPLQALAPPKLTAFPGFAQAKQDASAPLDVNRFLFVVFQNYTGEVTYDVSEGTVAFIAVKAGQQYPGIKQGDEDPAFYPVPDSKCESLMVLGRKPGVCTITAWGVKAEKDSTGREVSRAVKLATYTVVVGGAKPLPDPKPVPDPKPPVTGKVAFWVLIEETKDATVNRSQSVNDAIAWSKANGVKHVIVDQNGLQYDPETKTYIAPPDLGTYLADAKGKKLPMLYLVTDKGLELWSGPRPDDVTAILKKHGGQ